MPAGETRAGTAPIEGLIAKSVYETDRRVGLVTDTGSASPYCRLTDLSFPIVPVLVAVSAPISPGRCDSAGSGVSP